MEATILTIVPKHLIEDQPILVYPTLAKIMGINKAVILQQLHFLLGSTQTSKNRYNFVGGRWWVYNTYKQWKEEYFPWLGESTIKKLMIELEKDGLVLSIQSVKNPSDRRKWYTIDYEHWDENLEVISSKLEDPSAKNEPMVTTAKNEPINNVSKLADGYTDTTTEKKDSVASDGEIDTTSKPKSERKPNPMYDAIYDIWGYSDALNGSMAKMLQGIATHKGFAPYNLREAINHEQLRQWAKWYRRTVLGNNPTLNMLEDRAKIQSSIHLWLDTGEKRADFDTSTGPREKDPEWEYKPQTADYRIIPGLNAPPLTNEEKERIRQEMANEYKDGQAS